jgi:hypothetical protein
MTLTNMKIGLAAAVAVVGLGTTALIQRNANTRLRNENEALRFAATNLALSVSPGAAPATLETQSTKLENSESGLLLARNVSLSNEVHRLQTRLALLEQPVRSTPREARAEPVPQTEDPAHQLALAALQGDLTALEKLGEMTKVAGMVEHPDLTPEEQTKLVEKLRPIWAAFHLFAEEAGMEKENALRVSGSREAPCFRPPSYACAYAWPASDLAGRATWHGY